MAEEIKENELNEVAGGQTADGEWSYEVACSCGYRKQFNTLAEATKALIEHVGDGKAHSCTVNVNKDSNK